MIKRVLISAIIAFTAVSFAQDDAKPKKYPGYKLVWADEFDKDGKPDPKSWRFEKGFVRNNELQWYQEENATVKDGKLIIEGRREKKPNPNYKKGGKGWKNRKEIHYTSSSINTSGMHSWQYGRFEIKAKIATKAGLWPAIWFLGVKGEWPSNGEIDLMEYYKGGILANACWGTKRRWSGKWDSSKTPIKKLGDPKTWDQDFHLWRMDWDEKAIKLYIDGKLLNTIELKKTINATDKFGGPKNPFKQPQYILLNLAIGGNSGGDPSKTEFPTQYVIDYVRVYQKTGQAKANDAASKKKMK